MRISTIVLLGATIFGRPTFATASDYEVEQAIVRLVPGESIDAVNADYGTTTLRAISTHDIYLLFVPPDQYTEDELEMLLENDVRVADSELNELTETPEDPDGQTQSFYFGIDSGAFPTQYAWAQVGTPSEPGLGGGVTVAIIDTGIDAGHEVLAGVAIAPGYDFVDNDADPAEFANGDDDDGDTIIDELHGHGTFQAGIIATIAPDATILPLRALEADGGSNVFHVCEAIYFALDSGAHVINLSLGMPDDNDILEWAIDDALDANVVVVASAGNLGGIEPTVYPAGISGVIGVASLDDLDIKSDFSSAGDHLVVSAPGHEIVSAVPDGFGQADGTSAAASFVSAAAALIVAEHPFVGFGDIREVIRDSATNVDAMNPDWIGLLGGGRLDITAALARADEVLGVFGDLNDDGVVAIDDLLMMLSDWGTLDSDADLNNDDVVDIEDLLLLLGVWRA